MSESDAQLIPLQPLTSPSSCSLQVRGPPPDDSRLSRNIGLVSLGVSAIIGVLFIASGIYIATSDNSKQIYDVVLPPTWPGGHPAYNILPHTVAFLSNSSHLRVLPELLRLAFVFVYTLCDASIGLVHSTTQKSMLIHTKKFSKRHLKRRRALQFNTNLRFFTVPRDARTFHPNNTLSNFIMASLHIIAYSSVSLSRQTYTAKVCPSEESSLICQNDDDWESVCVSAIPIIILGTCIVLQTVIASAGVHHTRIITWSSSPIDTTAALLRDGHVVRGSGRCMFNVLDTEASKITESPQRMPKSPSLVQPSAWEAHRGIRRVIKALWVSALICGAWGGIIVAAWHGDRTSVSNFNTPGLTSWAFIPTNQSNAFLFGPSFTGEDPVPALSWVLAYLTLVVCQGTLTMILHCAELIVNVLRDEDVWRKAVSRQGTKPQNVVVSHITFWPANVLQFSKIFFHWVFGLCLTVEGTIVSFTDFEDTQISLQVVMRSVQVWYLAITLTCFCIFVTNLATRHPKGPQPVAYGHIQTLANLIDDWAPDLTMWWGHKEGEQYEEAGLLVYHAGTKDSPLPPVNTEYMYA